MSESQEYRRLHEVFAAVVERAPHERGDELDRLCGDDPTLRLQVEALLQFHDQEEAPLERPLVASETRTLDHVDTGVVRLGPTEQVGDWIDDYRLQQEIGKGGFGVVYMAEQKEPVRRKVALKIIKLGMDTKQVIARFEVERQALAMMDHPNIAKVLDAGATETGRPYFVMELVRGDPVTEYCDRNNLGTKDRIRIFQQICHAVQHAHQKGIIHRDLKPGNVLVTVADGRAIPKVIDFGIAKATDRELTDKTLFTEFRQLIGTPEYMSPEQAEMTGVDIDTRSDVYALGVLLYELLTGTTPFDPRKLRSAAYGEIQRIIREEEPPRPSTRLHSLLTAGPRGGDDQPSSINYIAKHRRTDPGSLGRTMRGDLDWIVMKCLEKDRTRRYDTAADLARDLQRYLDHEPVSAGPPDAAYRARKFIRRNRVAVLMVIVVGLSLVLGMIGTTWQAIRATNAEAEATRELTRANEVKRIITDMLESVKPEHAEGRDITVLREILDGTARRLAAGEIEDELIAAELHTVIGSTYRSLGLLEPAKEHLQIGERIYRRVLGAEAEWTLFCVHLLALVLNDQWRHAEAEALHARNLSLRRKTLGEDHPSTLLSMTGLGTTYRRMGRFEEAEAIWREVLEKQQQRHGVDHPFTLTTMMNVASALGEQGRHSEAEATLRECIRLSRQAGTNSRLDTASMLENLAAVLNNQQRYEEAYDLFDEALATRLELQGDDHPRPAATMLNIAVVHMNLGNFAESESTFREAIGIQQRLLGDDHPASFETSTSMATLYMELGKYQEAVQLLTDCSAALARSHGPNYPPAIKARTMLANALKESGRYAEAERVLVDVVAAWERFVGPDHPDTLGAINDLANVYTQRGRYAEARSLYVDVVDRQKRALGMSHRYTLTTMGNLAALYMALAEYERAESLLRETIGLKDEVMGPEHSVTLASKLDLARLCGLTGRGDEAEQLFREVLGARRRTLGEDNPRTHSALNVLGLFYKDRGRFSEAEEMLTLAREGRTQVLGREHPDTLGTTTNLGLLYLAMQRYEDARAMFERSLPAKRRVLGNEHPWTRFAMSGLAEAYEALGRLDDARPLQRELLDLEIAAAREPDAPAATLNDVAWNLATHTDAQLRDPDLALEFALRANELLGGTEPYALDTLARVLFETGDVAGAIETQARAIDLLAEDAPDRQYYLDALHRYEEDAVGGVLP